MKILKFSWWWNLLSVLLMGGAGVVAQTPLQWRLDTTSVQFFSGSSSGSAGWRTHFEAVNTVDNGDGMRSPTFTGAGEAWIEAQVTGPEQVSFFWAHRSGGVNRMACRVNGVERVVCAATVEGRWQRGVVDLPAGVHTVRWVYSQSGSVATDAWLDWVSLKSETGLRFAGEPWHAVNKGAVVQTQLAMQPGAVRWGVKVPSVMPPGLGLVASTGVVMGLATKPGRWRTVFTATTAGGEVREFAVTWDVTEPLNLASAADSDVLAFSSEAAGGNGAWQPQAGGGRGGGDSLLAGGPGVATGWSDLTTTVTGPDVMSWWSLVERGGMRVMVDGVVREVLGLAEGVETWRRSWVVIPAGVHEVRWRAVPYRGDAVVRLDDVRLRSEVRPFFGELRRVGAGRDGVIRWPLVVGGAGLGYAATGLPEGVAVDPVSGLLAGQPVRRGRWLVNLKAENAEGSDEVACWVDATVPVGEAVDNAGLFWGGESGSGWYGEDAVDGVGGSVLRSPPLVAGRSAAATVAVQGPAVVLFRVKVTGAGTADGVSVLLDGKRVQAAWRGEVPWRDESVLVPAGLHELSWVYEAGAGTNPAVAMACLDRVEVRSYYTWAAGIAEIASMPEPEDDPDKDGLSNALEYALGSDPAKPTNPPGLTVMASGSVKTVEWMRPAASVVGVVTKLEVRRSGAARWSGEDLTVLRDDSRGIKATVPVRGGETLEFRVRATVP